MKTLSIILITYNSEKNLEKTLASIEKQDYPSIEVIIRDRGSTDRTLHVIDVYAKISKYTVKWCTGNDNGIYNAMNQGYQMATGDIITYFNDLFQGPAAVSRMIQVMEGDPECVGAYADLVYATEEKVIRRCKTGSQKNIHTGWIPEHAALFLKREVYEKYGLYHSDYRIAGDYEFMIRFLKDKDNRLTYLPETIVRMNYGRNDTRTQGGYLLSLKESRRALKENGIKGAFGIEVLRIGRISRQYLLK